MWLQGAAEVPCVQCMRAIQGVILCRCGGIGCSAACCCGHHWPGASRSSCSTSRRAWRCDSTAGAASAHRGSGSISRSAGCRAPGCSAGERIPGVLNSDTLTGLLQSQQVLKPPCGNMHSKPADSSCNPDFKVQLAAVHVLGACINSYVFCCRRCTHYQQQPTLWS